MNNLYGSLGEKDSNFISIRIEDFFKEINHEYILQNHQTDFYTILFYTNDIGRHAIDFKDFYYAPGTFLVVRKNQIHKFYHNPNATGYLLFFKEEFLNRYVNEDEIARIIQIFNEFLTSPKTQCPQEDLQGLLGLFEGIITEYDNIDDDYSPRIIRSLLHLLANLIHRIKSRNYNKIVLKKNLRDFIKFQGLVEKNYGESKKVSYYANLMGFSSKKLNSIVQFIANKPAKDFIDDVAIIKIKKELLYTNLSIKEIAFKVGFADSTNFFKYFKNRTDFTPKEYRDTYQK